MSAEYLGDSVKLKMESLRMKKQSRERMYQYILLIVIVFSIALIACPSIINSQIRDAKTKCLKEEQDSKTHLQSLVNKHVGSVGLDIRDLTIDLIMQDIQKNIYTKIKDYGDFFMFDKAARFISAKFLCQKIGGHLVEFNETDSVNTQKFLSTLKKEFVSTSFWIGLTAKDNDGKFKWLKAGTNFSETSQAQNLWSNGSPTNVESKPCVATDHLNSSEEKVTITNVECNDMWDPDYQSHVICQKLH